MIWACNNPPLEGKIENGKDAYADEAGFQTHFTTEELSVVQPVTQRFMLSKKEYGTTVSNFHIYNTKIHTVVQNYDTAYAEEATDTFFVPDVKQLYAIYENGDILDYDETPYFIATPTAQCIAASIDSTLSFDVPCHYWLWTATASAAMGTGVRAVYPDGTIYGHSAAAANVGVRPAFYFKNEMLAAMSGDGTIETPYAFRDYQMQLTGYQETADGWQLQISLDNRTEIQTEEARLFTALWDEKGILKECHITVQTMVPGLQTITPFLTSEPAEGQTMITYLWHGMTPLGRTPRVNYENDSGRS